MSSFFVKVEAAKDIKLDFWLAFIGASAQYWTTDNQSSVVEIRIISC